MKEQTLWLLLEGLSHANLAGVAARDGRVVKNGKKRKVERRFVGK